MAYFTGFTENEGGYKGRRPVFINILLIFKFMEKLIKKVLTSKEGRNITSLSAFVVTAVGTAGIPWAGK